MAMDKRLILRSGMRLYGRVTSFFIHRVGAVWFMVLGTLMSAMDLIWLLLGKQPSWGIGKRLVYVLMPLFIAFIGLILWRTYNWAPSTEEDDRAKNPWE